MSYIVTPIGNNTPIAAAHKVHNQKYLLVTVTGSTDRTITVATTVSTKNGGGKSGSLILNAGDKIIIKKQPTDTISGGNADVKATPVAPFGSGGGAE
mgnify:CR=1 FL=1